jgi:hypothetical protein
MHARRFAAVSLLGLVMGKASAALAQPVSGTSIDPGAASPASAERAAPTWPAMNNPDEWRVSFNPRAWLVSPSGKIRLPSSTTPGARVRVEDLNIDTPLLSPAGEMALQFGDWRVSLSGFNYGVERTTTAGGTFQFGDLNVTPGSTLGTNFDFTSVQAQVGYRIYEHDFGAVDGRPDRTALRLDLVGGIRYYDLDIDASLTGASQTVERTFGEVYAGGHAELQLVRDFSIDLDLTGGGYGDSSNSVVSIDVAVAFSWRPVDGVAVQIGWRQLAFDLTNGEGAGEFEYSGRMAGLFAGVVLRF